MTEAEWLECEQLPPMLRLLDEQRYKRKVRFFCCACSRLVWASLTDTSHSQAVELTEEYADGLVDSRVLANAQNRVHYHRYKSDPAGELALNVTFADAGFNWEVALGTATCVLQLMGSSNVACRRQALCKLFRHIIGNPFKSYPAPATWPSVVVELAQALYNGAGERLVLANSLEEAGHGELAVHFRNEESHPKGCWVIDLILGKR